MPSGEAIYSQLGRTFDNIEILTHLGNELQIYFQQINNLTHLLHVWTVTGGRQWETDLEIIGHYIPDRDKRMSAARTKDLLNAGSLTVYTVWF